jgi:chemotaxis protein methyltransferase CheR
MLVSPTRHDIERLAEIVRKVTGNQVSEKNFPMLESRIRSHASKLGLKTMADYWLHFSKNEDKERLALQSLMTTHYTFFFREFVHFEVLETWLAKETPRLKERWTKHKQVLRVWSAACSKGQEVYSLAMFLDLNFTQKTGVPFEIVGTDIDAESVAFGRNGVYPLPEVNTIPTFYLSPYWKKGTGSIKDFAAIHPKLRERTRFDVVNLMDQDKVSSVPVVDVIFCRNVLIYFSEENVQKIALGLASRLEDNGLFISGVSESLRFPGWNLTSMGPSCYYKGTVTKTAPVTVPAPAAAPTPKPSAKLKVSVAKPLPPPAPVAAPAAAPVPTVVPVQRPYRVLCVDDSPTIQMLIKKIFSADSACLAVDVAANGKEARLQLDKNKYDLITLDIHMPEVNGIEFLERLYVKKSDPPVIMISSVNRTDLDLATKALSLGAFDYVQKPAMNNLATSSEEILTKAKMALRIGKTSAAEASASVNGGFDSSIGQKIVVPDASQCVRVVFASDQTLPQLQHVVKGQATEYRSPALVLVVPGSRPNLEAEVLKWTERTVVTLRDVKQPLRPNHVYVIVDDLHKYLWKELKFKNSSLQWLAPLETDIRALKTWPQCQVLISEEAATTLKPFLASSGLEVSDITPVTSFPSLSVEFFAQLRKAAA